MKLASMLAWRSLASRPARSFTAALGIGVGIATVLSVQVVDHNTILTQQRQAIGETLGQPDVEIRPLAARLPDGGAAPLEVARDRDVEAFCGLYYERAEILGERPVTATDAGPDVTVVGIGPLAASVFGAYSIAEGRDFSATSADELLLPERVAVDRSLEVGDRVTLQRAHAVRRGCLDGKLVAVETTPPKDAPPAQPRTFEVVGLLAPHHLGAQPVFVLPFESGATLFSDAHLQPLYWARLKSDSVWQDVAERMKARWTVEKPKGALVGERIDQKAFRKSLGITSCLALLLGLFVIYNAFSLALVERVREIGLLRALGLTRGEIVRAVLLEGFLLAVGGALLGALLSVALVAFMNAMSITTLGAGKPLQILEVPWGLALGVVALGMLFALLGMTTPLLRARHLSVIEALRAGRLALRSDPGFSLRVGVLLGVPLAIPLFFTLVTPPLGDRQSAVNGLVLELAAVVAGFFLLLLAFPGPLHRAVEAAIRPLRALAPIEGRLAAAAIRGARQRILATLTGLAVVVAAVFVVRSVNDGFLDEIARFSKTAMEGRVFVRTRPRTRAEAEAELKLPGVARIDSASAEVRAPFPLRGLRAESLAAEQQRLGLPDAVVQEFARGDSLILSRFLAEQMGWRVGDTVNLATFDGTKAFKVGAITDRIGYWPDDRSHALIEMARLDQLFCLDDAESKHFILTLEPGADGDAIERTLLEKLPRSPDRLVRSAATIESYYLRDGRRDFYVFDVILWCTAALAAVGLLNSLAIALLERQREIGLLRTIGLTARQVGRMLLLEAVALGVVGGALATLLAAPVSKLVLDAVRIISRLDLRFRLEPVHAMAPFFAAVAIAIVAAVVPAIRGGKLDLGPLHRHE
jgi:putative ABC transport system permease protein